MGGLRAAVFDEAPSVGAADGCALHKRVGRNFAGVQRRLGDDVLSLPLCVCRRFEREYGSLCGWRLVRCARVQGGLSGGLCAGHAVRFREASETKQTFRLLCRCRMRTVGRFCHPSYDMRIGFTLAGGPVARTAGFAAVWQRGCTAVHAARGRRLTWLTAVHGGDGRVSAGVRRLRNGALFSFAVWRAVLAKENAGSYASGALSAAPADKAAFQAAFARELRCGRRALRSGAMFCADGAARRVCGRAVRRRRACFRPRGSKSAAKCGLKNMNQAAVRRRSKKLLARRAFGAEFLLVKGKAAKLRRFAALGLPLPESGRRPPSPAGRGERRASHRNPMQDRAAVLVRSFFVPSFGGVGGGMAARPLLKRRHCRAESANRFPSGFLRDIALTAAETAWKAQRNGAAAFICLFVLPCTGRRWGRSRPLPE